jgi:3-oxoacyl-[acyl-carrier-protein] synthase II
VGTSKGSIEEWFSPPPVTPTSDKPSSGLRTSGLADIAATLAADLGTRGPLLTLSAACASGLHALIRASMMIRSGEVRQAVVVATEASVHPLFLGSFQRLGVLAKPGYGCRPFDRNRSGFYMSEAACAVLLEAADPDDRASRSVFVENFALGGDATHLTGGDPDGRLLRHLLNKVVASRPVDLVHAHGTGTVLNDETELAAIEATVGAWAPDRRPTVYSHKAALGHSLGASGLLSVVLNCQSHATGIIPPNVRTTEPLPTRNLTIGQTITRRQITRSLAMAAGFGGPTAVVSLTSYPKP